MRKTQLHLYWRWLVLLIFLGPGLGVSGCKGKTTTEVDPSLAFRKQQATKPIKGDDLECPELQIFSEPGIADVEYPFAEVYRAALMPDGKRAFARFAAQFMEHKEERFLKAQLWPRVRKHVRKYVEDPEDFSFGICRREVKPNQTVKIYIRSLDPQKSHPPSTVTKVGSAWKLDFFSY